MVGTYGTRFNLYSKGNWNYDSKSKSISLLLKGESRGIIVSLRKEEFIMLAASSNEAVPDDMKEMQMVFKPKN